MIKTKVYNQSFYLTRSVIQYLKSFQSQHYSTVEATTQNVTSEENSSFKTSNRKTRDSVCKDLVKYLTSHNPSLDIKSVPETYLTKRKSIKTLYLANSQTAAMVAKLLKPHIHQCKAEVIECRPGLGLLTDHLLNMKITKLNLHEPDPFFYQNLLKLGSKDKVKIFNNDMVQIPKYNPTKRKPDLTFDYIEKKNWKDECIFQLIATLTNQDFLRYLLRNFTNQDGLLSYGRPLMYLFITPSTYQKLIAGPHQPWNLYKPLAVLFQIIFNIELLSKVDRNAFIPWPTVPVTAKKTELKEEEPMYLIKVEGKRDVYQKLGKHNAHRVNTLQKFVTHVIGRKKQRVIPTIEQWVPGFGPHLIARNISVFTLFNELTPAEMFDIFCMIHHIPGYEEFDIPVTLDSAQETKKHIDTSIDFDLEVEEEEDEEEVEDPDDGLGGLPRDT